MWLDISLESLFGTVLPVHVPLSSPTRLTCQDPCMTDCYNQLFLLYLHEHQLIQKAFQLQMDMTHLSAADLQRQYNSIDAQWLRGMRYAESHCCKLQMGAHSHTPEYSITGKTLP